MKRILYLIAAVVTLLTCTTFCNKEASVVIIPSVINVKVGETANYQVNVSGNYQEYIAGRGWEILDMFYITENQEIAKAVLNRLQVEGIAPGETTLNMHFKKNPSIKTSAKIIVSE